MKEYLLEIGKELPGLKSLQSWETKEGLLLAGSTSGFGGSKNCNDIFPKTTVCELPQKLQSFSKLKKKSHHVKEHISIHTHVANHKGQKLEKIPLWGDCG